MTTEAADSGGKITSSTNEALLGTQSVEEPRWKLDPRKSFSTKKKTEEQLQNMRHHNVAGQRRRELKKFYRRQNSLIDDYFVVEGLNPTTEATVDEEARMQRRDIWAFRLSNSANVLLLVMKVVVATLTGSLSIIVSALDSVLDLVSGVILSVTHWSMRKRNKYKYPIGKERMEPLGIIVFACIMGTLGCSISVEAIRQLLSKEKSHIDNLGIIIGIMGGVIVIKLLLFLFCRLSSSDSVQAFAQDHLFDVVTNSVGLVGACLGKVLEYWMDPLAALLLAVWVTYFWSKMAYETVVSLVGVSAPPEFLSKLTFICWNHDPAIKVIDTVRAYTFGKSFFVEVDIVLAPDMPLHQAHDIGEALQNKLEALPEVERAFCHLDYETSHRPEHKSS